MPIDISGLEDSARWAVTLLPVPKRQRRAKALGVCGSFAVGFSEGAGIATTPQWWPHGQPAALVVPGKKRVEIGRASGREIPGGWLTTSGSRGGAVGWHLDDSGALLHVDLHPEKGYAWTMALGAGGGMFAGYGQAKGKRGEKVIDRAIAWRPDSSLVLLPARSSGEKGIAQATDGQWVVGRVGDTGEQQAALWNAQRTELVTLGDGRSASEANGVGDGEQVGVFWRRSGEAAALWRGTPSSRVDLTPKGCESAGAAACARGLQVGYARIRNNTPGGTPSLASRAVLWAGNADSWIDLQAMVPAPWNASAAWGIDVDGSRLRIVGQATQFEVADALTPQEKHSLGAEVAIVWEAQVA